MILSLPVPVGGLGLIRHIPNAANNLIEDQTTCDSSEKAILRATFVTFVSDDDVRDFLILDVLDDLSPDATLFLRFELECVMRNPALLGISGLISAWRGGVN